MTLGIGIGNVGAADLFYLVKQRAISQHRPSQFSPVIPAATRYHVVDGGEREALMVQVAVKHWRGI